MGAGTSLSIPEVQTESSSYMQAIESAREIISNEESEGRAMSSSVEIYAGIIVAKDVRSLDLSNKDLEGSLKAEIRLITELQELDLSNNNFTGLPAEVGQLSNLRVLNLSYNPFTGLPNELGNLQNLEVLNLVGTNYSQNDLDTISANLPPGTKIIVNE